MPKAYQLAAPVRGEKTVFISHILGVGRSRKNACKYSGQDAIQEAESQVPKATTDTSTSGGKHSRSASSADSAKPVKKSKQPSISTHMYTGTEMPFSTAQIHAIHAQALRAVISANLPFHVYENPEVLKLISLLRSAGPAIMPSAKLVGGRLLNDAAEIVERKMQCVLKGRIDTGISADGWKSATKMAVNGLAINIDGKSYALDLVEITADDKHGIAMAMQFGELVDRVEASYDCTVVYFTTDSDGGAKKGRILLGKERPWMLVPSCWAHQVHSTNFI